MKARCKWPLWVACPEGLGLTLTWQHSTYMGETEMSPDPEMHLQQFVGKQPSPPFRSPEADRQVTVDRGG